MIETWKKIKGFSMYEYSCKGNLRSLNYKRTGKIRVLKPAISIDGYLKTMLLSDCGKYKTIAVHRVIMESEKDKPTDKHEVNHINGIKTDNSPINLEWVTHSQNCQHSFDIGIQKPKRGELNGMSKLTKEDVVFLRNEKKKNGRYWGRNEYAKKYGISAKHLQKIVNSDLYWK